MIVKYLLPLAALGLLGFAVYYVTNNRPAPAQPVASATTPARAPYKHTVAAAGMVEPQSEDIAVGSPVPGLVVEVFVKEEDKVDVGAPLFRLDDRQLKAELVVREAALKSAEAQLLQLNQEPRKERIPVSRAAVAEAEANLADQSDQLKRAQELFNKNFASEQELMTRRQAFRAAEAQVARVKAELDLLMAGAWEYERAVAEAAVEQARSQVEATQIELDRLTIRALTDGEVLQVNVRPGEFVGAPANQGLVILGSVRQLHVRVDIDEHDIPRFVPGSAAKATVRGNPTDEYALQFVRVEPYVVPKKSLTGMNTERVDTRVLQAIYSLEPTEGKPIYVGQQLEVFIEVKEPDQKSATASSTAAVQQ